MVRKRAVVLDIAEAAKVSSPRWSFPGCLYNQLSPSFQGINPSIFTQSRHNTNLPLTRTNLPPILYRMTFTPDSNDGQDLGFFPVPILGSDMPIFLRETQGTPRTLLPVSSVQLRTPIPVFLNSLTMSTLKRACLLTCNDNRCQASGAQIARNGAWSSGCCLANIVPSARLHVESCSWYVD